MDNSQVESTRRRIKEVDEFLEKESTKLTEYDEGMVRSYIQSIRIYDDHFQVVFKAGWKLGLRDRLPISTQTKIWWCNEIC